MCRSSSPLPFSVEVLSLYVFKNKQPSDKLTSPARQKKGELPGIEFQVFFLPLIGLSEVSSFQRRACCCSSRTNACFSISFLNSPSLFPSSSVGGPHSATRRWSITATESAFLMVDRRWAMITTVLPVQTQRRGQEDQVSLDLSVRWMEKKKDGESYLPSGAPTPPEPGTHSQHPEHWRKTEHFKILFQVKK